MHTLTLVVVWSVLCRPPPSPFSPVQQRKATCPCHVTINAHAQIEYVDCLDWTVFTKLWSIVFTLSCSLLCIFVSVEMFFPYVNSYVFWDSTLCVLRLFCLFLSGVIPVLVFLYHISWNLSCFSPVRLLSCLWLCCTVTYSDIHQRYFTCRGVVDA